MFKSVLSAASVAFTLAACTSASGPTFNAYSIDLADGSRAYRAECHGLFETTKSCVAVAKRICADQPVRWLDRREGQHDDPAHVLADPRTLTFQCGQPPAPVPAPVPVAAKERVPAPVVAPIVLSGDALFEFDRSDINGLKPGGRAALDDVAARLRATKDARRIRIAGYTDRLGSDAYNVKLSQRRADTVKSYLEDRGVTANIVARGYGAARPGAACGMRDRAALIRCLSSDRRVEISPYN